MTSLPSSSTGTAPSSTPFDGLRNSLLAARDARHALLCKAVRAGGTVVFLSLNIPGANKRPPGSAGLFRRARLYLAEALPEMVEVHGGIDALGPYVVLAGKGCPHSVKRHCVGLETCHPSARLLDLDVYDDEGRSVDRLLLELPQRSCLLCRRPAKECIRRQRHSEEELKEKIHELLAPFTD